MKKGKDMDYYQVCGKCLQKQKYTHHDIIVLKKYQKTLKILVSNEAEDSYFSHAAKLQSTNKKVSRMFY